WLCLDHPGGVLAIAFHPAGNLIAIGCDDRKVHIRDGRTGQAVGQLLLPGRVNALAFSPDGERLLVGTGHADGTRRTVSLWQGMTPRRVSRLWQQNGPVWAVAFSADGERFVTGSTHGAGGGAVQLWDAGRGHPLGEPCLHPRPVRAVALAPDGQLAASGCDDRNARLWQVASGK